MKQIIIIGNSKIDNLSLDSKSTLKKLMKKAEIVIRFNKLYNFQKEFGNKTTIYCCTNKGEHSKHFPNLSLLLKLLIFRPKSLLFTYPIKINHKFNNIENHIGVDYSERIMRKLFFIKNKEFIDEKIFSQSLKLVNYESNGFIPSSGLLLINHILNKYDIKEYKVSIIGFTWKGWKGHNWEAERKYFENLISEGKIQNLII